VTSRGMREAEMKHIERFIDEAVEAAKAKDDDAIDRIFGQVKELTKNFPAPGLD
jgi:glycine hydroxymethyltransferase